MIPKVKVRDGAAGRTVVLGGSTFWLPGTSSDLLSLNYIALQLQYDSNW